METTPRYYRHTNLPIDAGHSPAESPPGDPPIDSTPIDSPPIDSPPIDESIVGLAPTDPVREGGTPSAPRSRRRRTLISVGLVTALVALGAVTVAVTQTVSNERGRTLRPSTIELVILRARYGALQGRVTTMREANEELKLTNAGIERENDELRTEVDEVGDELASIKEDSLFVFVELWDDPANELLRSDMCFIFAGSDREQMLDYLRGARFFNPEGIYAVLKAECPSSGAEPGSSA